MRLLLLVLFAAACGTHPAPAPPAPGSAAPAPGSAAPAPGDPKADGTEGAVCAWGGRSPHHDDKAPACHAGLSCCYPCGVDGCNSVCMNVKACPEIP